VKPIECACEQDVLDAVASRRWPDDLRGHVAECAICADVAAVAAALQDDHADAWTAARVPPSGAVWWRLELRARTEAARTAARPITVIQTIAAACAAIVLIVFAGLMSPWLRQRLALSPDFGSWLSLPTVDVAAVIAQGWLPVALAVGISLALVPVAVYFVVSEE
jgi:hypothetical protein